MKVDNTFDHDGSAEFLRAISNPTRMNILWILSSHNGRMSNQRLLKWLGVPKANLSQHLAVLYSAGVVRTERARDGDGLQKDVVMVDDPSAIQSILIYSRDRKAKRKYWQYGI